MIVNNLTNLSSGKLYQHVIKIIGKQTEKKYQICFNILNNDSSAYSSLDDIITAVENAGNTLMASGSYYDGTTLYTVNSVYKDSTSFYFRYYDSSTNINSIIRASNVSSVNDTVTQIL